MAQPQHRVGADPKPQPTESVASAPDETEGIAPRKRMRRGPQLRPALDTRFNRKLALKTMLPKFAAHPAAKERFLREARAAAQIAHDNVVTVYEADERDGVP